MATLKTHTETSTLIENGAAEPSFERLYKEFNAQGQLVLEIERIEGGEELRREEYTYDEQGRKVREYKHFVQDEMEQTHAWVYDDQGRVIEERDEYAGGFATVKHLSYEGDTIQIKITDEEGNPEGREVRTLNAQGKEVERVVYDEEDTLKERITREYNEEGKLVHLIQHGWDDAWQEEWMYVYDDDGHLLQEKQLNRAGYIILRRQMEYSEGGHLTSYVAEDLETNRKIARALFLNDEGQLEREERYEQNLPEPTAVADYTYENGQLVKEHITRPQHEIINEYAYTWHDA